MKLKEENIILNDGREVLLRSPEPKDAEAMIENLKTTAVETDFLVRYPEEYTKPIEAEERFLEHMCQR